MDLSAAATELTDRNLQATSRRSGGSMHETESAPNNHMHLPYIERAVLQENFLAMNWRWELAQKSFNWQQNMESYFPGQQELFRILGQIDRKRAHAISNVTYPLFAVHLPAEMHFLQNTRQSHPLASNLAVEAEDFLQNRLNCISINEMEAIIVYDLKHQFNLIKDKTVSDLRCIANSPGISVRLAVSIRYIYNVAFKEHEAEIIKRVTEVDNNFMNLTTKTRF